MKAEKLDLSIFRKLLSNEVEDNKFLKEELKSNRTNEPPRIRLGTTSGFLVQSLDEESDKPPPNLSCTFCLEKGDHFSKRCSKVQDLATRIDRLEKNQRCFKCLGPLSEYHWCTKICRFCFNPLNHVTICPQFFGAPLQNDESDTLLKVLSLSEDKIFMLATEGKMSSQGGKE